MYNKRLTQSAPNIFNSMLSSSQKFIELDCSKNNINYQWILSLFSIFIFPVIILATLHIILSKCD